MRETNIRRAILGIALLVVACGSDAGVTSTTPPPATPEQIEEFCDHYFEVRDDDWSSRMNALIDVAPAEIRGSVVRIANGPGENYWQDRRRVEDFTEKCRP